MRRLPVYLLLDTSGSMMGEPIEQVKNGVAMMVTALRADPYALETAFISVITFDSDTQQLVPLSEITAFQTPEIKASGTTSMGKGLAFLAECASKEIVKTSPEVRGDWKPMVFIMTDGSPTDDWKAGFKRFQEEKWGIIVGCAVNSGNTDVLKEIAGEAVVQLDSSDPASISAFFKWVSASVSSGSQKVETGGGDIGGLDDLPPPPKEINVVI